MSSSFPEQPPRDPRHDEGYTTAPRPLDRRTAPVEDEEDRLPKLGSLAQKARGKQLKQARGILLVIGALTVLLNGVSLFTTPSLVKQEIDNEVMKQGGLHRFDPVQLEQARKQMLLLNYTISGLFLGMGILFLIFGAFVYRYPLPITITSLVLYLLATAAMVLLNPMALALGAIIRIIIIIALAKSIQSAYIYEKERRLEAEYEPA